MEPLKYSYKNLLDAIFNHLPKGHFVVASFLAITLCAVLTIFPSENAEATRQTVLDLNLPSNTNKSPLRSSAPLLSSTQLIARSIASLGITLKFNDLADAITRREYWVLSAANTLGERNTPAARWQEFEVKSGDSLSIIFKRAGLNDRDIYELFNESAAAKELRHIVPGQKVKFDVTDEGKLQQLVYVRDRLNSLNFSRTSEGFASEKIQLQPDVQIAFRHATINSSLFLAGKNAGMSNNLIMELANIFAWDIDFALDIHSGDNFKIMYEERYLDGQKIGTGDILAAEFTNKDKTFKAVRYTDSAGLTHYYTPSGESMRKEFLRMPVDFARISSHFNLNRKHPILHTLRAHKGTDYAAARGTPIKASGDGKVIFAGRKGGYGNTVILQHGQAYKTLYAHMHNFGKGVRVGTRVRQGQIIGYVGTTGLSTGPHLHYEFYVNGAVRNPMTVSLPKANSIASSEKPGFLAQTQPIIAQLEQYFSGSRLAMAKDEAATEN